MKIKLDIDNKNYRADLSLGQSIAITLKPDEAQPNHFGAPNATSQTLKVGDYIGDTSSGGSCNVNILNIIPHCNGTHTESVSHIIDELFPLYAILGEAIFPSVLITTKPEIAAGIDENYIPSFDENSLVISRNVLQNKLTAYSDAQLQGLVVRTLDNNLSKKQAIYDNNNYPPFFSNDAMKYLVERGVKHLMVDFPSVDKMYDDGLLSNHRIFWNINLNETRTNAKSTIEKTITEMIFVDNSIQDGLYLCNLQLPKIKTDAVPSNPVLYLLEEI